MAGLLTIVTDYCACRLLSCLTDGIAAVGVRVAIEVGVSVWVRVTICVRVAF